MERLAGKTAVVTGGSSGIGRATAAALARAGCLVYEFSRREIPQEGVRHLSVDVTREEAVQDAVNQILSEEGRIDIVVNCAGFGISGAVNHVTGVDAETFIAVNSDPNAAIFNYCDYGIVADMDEVCDAMIARLKSR